jgi:outer membrane protein assembly factor BamD (BamD/ComL family)
MQKHTLDVRKTNKEPFSWDSDGDIHVFDFKFYGMKVPRDNGFIKIDCPHEGIWIVSYKGELPENVGKRIMQISTDGTYCNAKNRPSISKDAKDNTAENHLSLANTAYDIRNYKVAITEYMTVYNKWPNHRIAPFAMFMTAQNLTCLYKFNEAIALFKVLVQKYPNSKSAKIGMYRIACLQAGHLDNAEEGITLFTQLIKKYPNDSVAADSLFNIASLHLLEGNTEQAIQEFTLLIKKFPTHYRAKVANTNLVQLSNK